MIQSMTAAREWRAEIDAVRDTVRRDSRDLARQLHNQEQHAAAASVIEAGEIASRALLAMSRASVRVAAGPFDARLSAIGVVR